MCAPLALGWASLAAAAGGTALGVVAQARASNAENAAAEYNAQINARNAAMAQMQAADAITRGKQEELQYRQRVAKFIGSQRGAYAAAGVQVDTGSPLAAQMDTAATGELDALTIRSNAEREAWGYQGQALNYKDQSYLAKRQKAGSGLAVGSTLLTGTAGLGGQYFRMKQAGIFG
ncbi:MAG TPA: hypothetical protein VLI39_07630 [Sedimentisphaerales bacterium]|nr:hypothetical protein [Sedimentisphaerales bacterium]